MKKRNNPYYSYYKPKKDYYYYEEHLDYQYANEKWVNGHGATFTECTGKPLHIDWIYGKNKLQLLVYNIILCIKFYRRKYGKDK